MEESEEIFCKVKNEITLKDFYEFISSTVTVHGEYKDDARLIGVRGLAYDNGNIRIIKK